ncbi:hypothetical protein L596_014994 [Steinernema carpocapsae]|uniref:F-box domain-containing protein n=1 Tax=Steinernema carpocapsae TaxID=34508 RepID=A0A4V6A2Z0_STECR|nr:hypothetical protein L596_014994 [Steinernema carpocapsae]
MTPVGFIQRKIRDYFNPIVMQFDITKLPVELLEKVLARVDLETLVRSGFLVSSQWNEILTKKSFWIERARLEGADLSCFPPLSLEVDVPFEYWKLYYYRAFNRNLIDNHSGQHGFKDWKIVNRGYSDKMKVEHPPVSCEPNPTLETEYCFVTSFRLSEKTIIIDFMELGVSAEILDHYRPHIRVSEWCSHRSDCAAEYSLDAWLLDEDSDEMPDSSDTHVNYHRNMRQWDDLEWEKAEHVFTKYPQGVRKVKLVSSGQDSQFWKGHYGSKMAHASVKLEFQFDEH